MANNNLPRLPPLESVLKKVRNSDKQKDDEIDYKREYERLRGLVESLQKKEDKRSNNCPILERETGNGRIELLPGKKPPVVCKYLTNYIAPSPGWQQERGYCKLTGGPWVGRERCPYV